MSNDNISGIVKNDPWLSPHTDVINYRSTYIKNKETELISEHKSLSDFANGHHFYGLHLINNQWVFREWAPNAAKIYMVGDFNHWQENEDYSLKKLEHGNWEISLAYEKITHKDLFKLLVYWEGEQGYRLPSYAKRVIQHSDTKVFDAQVWMPEKPYEWKHTNPDIKSYAPLIYEAHVGMSSPSEDVSTYAEFKNDILPRVKKAGYNAIQLMAIQEHPYYGSFGYHVSNFFAPSSRFGTPYELKELIDEAHGMGIAVIMDIVHSHAVKNEMEGLGNFAGDPYQYFYKGIHREHIAWDSLCFDYGKNEVLHFLLSNCKYWLEEFRFDGFRFDGVTSMLYFDHGLGRDFTNYSMYYDEGADKDAITYLTLANKLIHEYMPGAISIAEDMSGMPGLAAPVEAGGYGFDYRLAMGIPDFWIKIIKELPDDAWNVGKLYHELTSKRADEKTIAYAESHDQALVGDKTIIFRLIDKEMYFSMDKKSQNLVIDRGIALHKIIRLITLATCGGGYLNFMGNEFGHPEWIDFPREGNNWSFKYAKRQWYLEDDNNLKYHYLGDFDRDMIELVKNEKIIEESYPNYLLSNLNDKVVAFERKGFIFVFNFHPTQSFTDYGIKIRGGKYKLVLNSDSSKYGGFERVDESLTYFTQRFGGISGEHFLKIYIPNRTALVFKYIPARSVYDV